MTGITRLIGETGHGPHDPHVESAPPYPLPGRPSLAVSFLAALAGLAVGGGVGFAGGLALGVGIAELTKMSCFEGACGFFAFFIALGGLVLGALVAAILAFWLTRRSRKPITVP